MDEAEAITRARQLRDGGRRAAALESLRARVRREPDEEAARRTLVGFYRELGAIDQAGRYGLAIAGLTTARERDRVARQFAASWARTAALRGFLALPDGDLPPEVLDLVVAVERIREEERSTWAARPDASAFDTGDLSFGFWAVTGALLATTLLAAVVADLAGAPWTALARWAAVAVVAVMLAGCLVERRLRSVRDGRAAATAWTEGAVALVLAFAGLLFAAIAVT